MKFTEAWRSFYQKKAEKLLYPIILIALLVVSYVLLCQMTKPESYQAKLFSVAEKTIRSPQTVEDIKKTQEEQQKASDAVDDVYIFNRDTSKNRVALVNSLFAYVNEVNAETRDQDAKNKQAAEKDHKPLPAPTPIDEKVKSLKTKLSTNVSEKITSDLSNATFQTLLDAKPSDLENAKKVITNEVEQTMEESIRSTNVSAARIKARDDIELSNMSSHLKTASKMIAAYAIVSNEIYSKQETNDRKKEAAESVQPIKILQGQVIVQEGQIIDREVYRQLTMLHLLDQKMPLKQYIGYAIFLAALSFMLYFFTKKQIKTKNQLGKQMAIFASIYFLALIMFYILRILEAVNLTNIAFIFPAAFAPVLLKILLNEKFAFLSIIFIAATGLFVFQSDVTSAINILIAIFILLSGTTSIILLRNYSRRAAIIQAGFFVGLLDIIYASLVLLINNTNLFSLGSGLTLLYGFIGGLGSFILAIGLIPIFETLFGILTTSRLIELASPNHPLLKKILMKAPGTYHHSMMVANLAEACADKIGANGLLVRVGCFYHDIGKTLRPPYFVENQLQGINPHDRLTPKQSRDIIIAHTTDGAAILTENQLPKTIIDIALQHHGTTLLKFFFFKEKEIDPDVIEAEFRYPGPKPQTKEAAIINISDSVEAAVRASTEPTKEKMKEIINSIIKDRLLDEQFSECDLTLQELEIIRETLNTTLNGIYHQRIQYPDDKKEEKEK